MSIYEIRTFEDVYKAVLEELKIPTSDTTSLNRIKRDINLVYKEILGMEAWKWARKNVDLTVDAYISTGTIAVTQGDKTITFSSAPTKSVEGYKFFSTGYSEHYRIASHTAGASTAELESEYTGTTNAAVGYRVYQNEIPLPVDVMDVHLAWNDHTRGYMESMPDREFRNLVLNSQRYESRPNYYTLTDSYDADEYSAISGLPALSTRASSGLVRTLVYASDVSSYLSEGDEIKIASSGDEDYNGEFIIEDVSTTNIQYVAPSVKEESATADATLSLQLKSDSNEHRSYLSLEIYPALSNLATTIHVDAIKLLAPLENDSDEPEIPLQYRMSLVYGACVRAWDRHRNPEMSVKNLERYNSILKKMRGKQGPGKDAAKLKMSQTYLATKRKDRRWSWWSF